jgi:hypothetical protein
MSAHSSLVTLVAVVITAILIVAQILLGAPVASAGGTRAGSDTWQTKVDPAPDNPIAPVDRLDAEDEVAALERIQYALSEVGDGTTYVWRRWHGRLSGVVRPTASFKAGSGEICRHLMVLLTTGSRTKKIEGIACRTDSGRWRLDG